MQPRPPFVDPDTGDIDPERVFKEAKPLGELIGLFALVAFVPFLGSVALELYLFNLLTQFVLAVGTCLVVLYVLVRSFQLAFGPEGGPSFAVDDSPADSGSDRATSSRPEHRTN